MALDGSPQKRFDYTNLAATAKPENIDQLIAQIRGDSQLSGSEAGYLLTELYKKRVAWQGAGRYKPKRSPGL
jgi:hypothetical protein